MSLFLRGPFIKFASTRTARSDRKVSFIHQIHSQVFALFMLHQMDTRGGILCAGGLRDVYTQLRQLLRNTYYVHRN